MKTKTNTLDKQLEKRHGSVFEVDNVIRIEGYLYKQGKRGFKTWNRRWFYLENNKLCYSKRTGDEVTVMEEDLRVCLVRPLTDIDRRFCFEIISPTKSHVLQVLLSRCSKSSFFIQKFNFDFPRKLSIILGGKTRENVVVLGVLAVDNFDFTKKIGKKNLVKNSWKCWGFVKIEFLDKNLTLRILIRNWLQHDYNFGTFF